MHRLVSFKGIHNTCDPKLINEPRQDNTGKKNVVTCGATNVGL